MEAAAKKFEQDGITGEESYCSPDEAGYFPYCQIISMESIGHDATRESKPYSGSTFSSPKECLAINHVKI